MKKSRRRKKIETYITVIGSIASIIGLIAIFYSKDKTNQLTIFVTDIRGNVVLENEGELNIPIGNRLLNAMIGEDGRTNFADITSINLNDTITVGLKVEGWELVDSTNTFVFTGEPIKLKIKRDQSLGEITGSVRSRDGQEFLQEALVRVNNDTTIVTDKYGVFKITLPEELQIEKKTDRYLLTISKEGYQTIEEYYSPLSSNADIRLAKK